MGLVLLYTTLLTAEMWPIRLLGQGGAAFACCYDPPAAVITPDPPAASAPAAPVATQNAPSDDELDSPSEAEDEGGDTPPVNLLDMPLTAARSAIADGEWLRAQIILLDAEEVFGAEPELILLKAEIDAHFGLLGRGVPNIAAPTDRVLSPLQPFSADADPLATMLADFGVITEPAFTE